MPTSKRWVRRGVLLTVSLRPGLLTDTLAFAGCRVVRDLFDVAGRLPSRAEERPPEGLEESPLVPSEVLVWRAGKRGPRPVWRASRDDEGGLERPLPSLLARCRRNDRIQLWWKGHRWVPAPEEQE